MKELENEVTAYFTEVGRIQGMEDTYLKIFSTLYLEPQEISLDELAKKTGYSLASISNKIKILESAGAIKKTSKPGSKRIYVYMEKNFIQIMKKQLLMKQELTVKFAKEKLPCLIKTYRQKAKTEEDKKKIKILEEYYKQIKKTEHILPKIIDLMNKA